MEAARWDSTPYLETEMKEFLTLIGANRKH